MQKLSHFFLFGLILVGYLAEAQESVIRRPSPMNVATSRYKDTYLKITYCQPQMKGRDIFGSLVPFGEVWRTGANEATELTVTGPILINRDTLKAGTYSVFTIPEEESWTIIFNADLGLWGSYNYNAKRDVLRIEAPVQKLDDLVYEPFTISILPRNDRADISFAWDTTQVTFSIRYLELKTKS
jgi:hypothetical protein